MKQPSKQQVITIILVVIVTLFLGWLITNNTYSGWDFRNNLWLPSYQIIHGQSPYNIEELSPHGAAVWFPFLIGYIFPIAFLKIEYASMIWGITNAIAVLGIILIVSNGKKPPLIPFTLCVLATFLFPPTVQHLKLGQFTLIACCLFLISAKQVPNKKWHPFIALLLVISLTKPQLSILFLLGMFLTIYKLFNFQQLLKFVGWMLFWMFVALLPFFFRSPFWANDFIQSILSIPDWVHPSLFMVLKIYFGEIGLTIWAIFALIIFFLNILIWLKLPPLTASYWCLALTPLISPYVWSWDFLLLFPLFFYAAFHLTRKKAKIILWAGCLSCWLLVYYIILQSNSDNFYLWWAPLWLFTTTAIALLIDQYQNKIPEFEVSKPR